MSYNKRILAVTLLFLSLACSKSKYNVYNDDAEKDIFDDSINYTIGNIYIGDEEYLNSLENISDDDVLVLDNRDGNDPDMKIINSYKINNINEMDYIINELLDYEKNNPSSWDRTHESMKQEWMIHNISYYLNYKRERSKDVDLNNKDEEAYRKVLIKR